MRLLVILMLSIVPLFSEAKDANEIINNFTKSEITQLDKNNVVSGMISSEEKKLVTHIFEDKKKLLEFENNSNMQDEEVNVADTGNTAWLMFSSALVMLMTPGLAFFYGGMVSRKNVVSTLLQNYVALALVGLMWVTIGYSLTFSEGNGFIGGLKFFMLDGIANTLYGDAKVPQYSFVAFQMMFAAITPALMTGSFAERVNFKAWILILCLWSLIVYVPVAHWVWGPAGWIAMDGGLDFAGGLVVHVTAGVAGLVAAAVFGRRIEIKQHLPNDIPMTMLGAALLWFGWFGFNAGSAIISGTLAAHAFLVTYLGASAALVAWMLTDFFKDKKPSSVSASIGLVVGLVTITPAAGYVTIQSSIIMCLISGVICNLVVDYMKSKTKIDDALDVFACHGVGGIVGAILTGFFADKNINSSITAQGFFVTGETHLLIANIKAVIVVMIYTALVSFIIMKIVDLITPIRVAEDAEKHGLDITVHDEMSKFNKKKR